MPERNPALLPGVLLSWGLVEAPGRGRPPGIGVGDIVAAAVALADAEGLGGVSMPRVARRVGVTQNALYRHVASKEELLVLIADAAVGEPPALDRDAGWRAAARAWATAVLTRYQSHPWLLDVRLRTPVTRNTVRWTEALLRALRGTGLGIEARVQCAMLLDGHARHAAALARDVGEDPGYGPALAELVPVLQRAGCGEFAAFLVALGHPVGPGGTGPAEPAEADFGLERILDGIGVLVEGTPPTGRPEHAAGPSS